MSDPVSIRVQDHSFVIADAEADMPFGISPARSPLPASTKHACLTEMILGSYDAASSLGSSPGVTGGYLVAHHFGRVSVISAKRLGVRRGPPLTRRPGS
jgi:hypothetical protein